ncbi:hypothetical protein [Natrinema sp. 1APR25-10V2]|uniref:hypothetical protein n=1 Tax=Natrinema sp. 1APR25-10V2 TaxID=2951081 RepID=UPI002874CC84|nr:hypothetical protein [Natrinema sp. 1APR25-10V2]MDS0478548.1 hypothetical protein [Natrinema sp. 1APR25-10V2]
MTADDRPSPPAALDRTHREALAELESSDPATLRTASRYLETLAAWKEDRTADDEAKPTPADGEPDTYPDGVPDRASVSVTEIAGTEYYYYQWREGDEIRSETVRR